MIPSNSTVRSNATTTIRTKASSFVSAPRKLFVNIFRRKQFKINEYANSSTKRNPASGTGSLVSPAHRPAFPDSQGRPGAPGARRVGIVWFRADLRIHDNEALTRANAECSSLVPVYCFDPRDYGRSPQGYDRTGPYRATFLIQAIQDLRNRLRAAGSELIVRIGRPEEVMGELVRRVGASAVYCHSEVTHEESAIEQRVSMAVESAGAKLKTFWGNTLHNIEDLPFKLADLPQNFDQFKSKISVVAPRQALPDIKDVKGMPAASTMEPGEVPTLQDLGIQPLNQSIHEHENNVTGDVKNFKQRRQNASSPAMGSVLCRGGETEAMKQLTEFVNLAKSSDSASNFANKVAPWLATGCLSPRRMLEDVTKTLGVGSDFNKSSTNIKTTAINSSNNSVGGTNQYRREQQWVEFELLWRDFFRLLTKKNAAMILKTVASSSTMNVVEEKQQVLCLA